MAALLQQPYLYTHTNVPISQYTNSIDITNNNSILNPNTVPNQSQSYKFVDVMKSEIISNVLNQIKTKSKTPELMMVTMCKIWNQVFSNGEMIKQQQCNNSETHQVRELQNRVHAMEQHQKQFQSNIISCIKESIGLQFEELQNQLKKRDIKNGKQIDDIMDSINISTNTFESNSNNIKSKLSKISVVINDTQKHSQTATKKSSNNNTKLNKLIKEILNIKKQYTPTTNTKTDSISSPEQSPNKIHITDHKLDHKINNDAILKNKPPQEGTHPKSNIVSDKSSIIAPIANKPTNDYITQPSLSIKTTTKTEHIKNNSDMNKTDKINKSKQCGLLEPSVHDTPDKPAKPQKSNDTLSHKTTCTSIGSMQSSITLNQNDEKIESVLSKKQSTCGQNQSTIDINNISDKQTITDIIEPFTPTLTPTTTSPNNLSPTHIGFNCADNSKYISTPFMEMSLTDTDIPDPSDLEYYDSSPDYTSSMESVY